MIQVTVIYGAMMSVYIIRVHPGCLCGSVFVYMKPAQNLITVRVVRVLVHPGCRIGHRQPKLKLGESLTREK